MTFVRPPLGGLIDGAATLFLATLFLAMLFLEPDAEEPQPKVV